MYHAGYIPLNPGDPPSGLTPDAKVDEDFTMPDVQCSAGCRLSLMLLAGVLLAACGGSAPDESSGTPAAPSGERQFISIGTAPPGGVFYTIGGAISDVLNDNAGEASWRVTAESTGGSMENIRRLDTGDLQFAVSNASITYFAVRGEEGWEKAFDTRSVMTLFPNVALFLTKQSSGIRTIGDLKGKRVAIGPEGAGFEYFVRPLLAAHGVSFDDFEDVYAGQQQCVDLLGDGSIDAAFLGGGVPTASITTAAASMDLHYIPFGEAELKQLVETYPFFEPATIPAGTYRGQDQDFVGLDVGSAHLITQASVSDDLVYSVTKTLYENRAALAEKHAAGKAINEKNAVKFIGTEFHPGSIRYFEEIGIWPGSTATTPPAMDDSGTAAP